PGRMAPPRRAAGDGRVLLRSLQLGKRGEVLALRLAVAGARAHLGAGAVDLAGARLVAHPREEVAVHEVRRHVARRSVDKLLKGLARLLELAARCQLHGQPVAGKRIVGRTCDEVAEHGESVHLGVILLRGTTRALPRTTFGDVTRPFTTFIGIDLGGSRGKSTALARLRWSRTPGEPVWVDEVAIRRGGADPWCDAVLVDYLRGLGGDAVVAIDAPLTAPACQGCQIAACPGYDACEVPATVWLRTAGEELQARALEEDRDRIAVVSG